MCANIEAKEKSEENKVKQEFYFLRDQEKIIDSRVKIERKNKKPFGSSIFRLGSFNRKIFFHQKSNFLSSKPIRVGLLHEAGHLSSIQNYHVWIIMSIITIGILYIFYQFFNVGLTNLFLKAVFILIFLLLSILIPSFFWNVFHDYLKKDEIEADEYAARIYKNELMEDKSKRISKIFSELFEEIDEMRSDNPSPFYKRIIRYFFPDVYPCDKKRVDLIKEKFDN